MELIDGYRIAYIDKNEEASVNPHFKPQFISNDYLAGKKVLTSIEDELLHCDSFKISVAFVTLSGIEPLLLTLKELEKRKIKGEILTTNYLCFSEPKALRKLKDLKNLTIKVYDVETAKEGFHTKGYIFKNREIYNIIIGSSNITSAALTRTREWNTKIVSTEKGEVANQILAEYKKLWNSPFAKNIDNFIELYEKKFEIVKKQRQIAKNGTDISFEKAKLEPNAMQVEFVSRLQKIIKQGEDRALLISATGTGKTYASAFAVRELGYRRVLFLVHRNMIAKKAKESFQNVFDESISMGMLGAGVFEYDSDFVFATRDTLCREEHLQHYLPNEFECIVLDEAHHVASETYQKIINYFKPKFWLGMTATPDRPDDFFENRNIYKIFNYQIAYEIRLQKAMEEDLLCPFHYFGISDLSMINDDKQVTFSDLVSDERIKHIIAQAGYYGHSGDRVKGLVFCSKIEESKELSTKFNAIINEETGKPYRTLALNGSATEDERQKAFERLAMDEEDATSDMQPLDYIFSVEILNEGVDIVEVNQVIMLRPTESSIVFVQQLGRGLRKAKNKEFVVVLDFIGNYNNNFMIPVALSGDRTYGRDAIRRFVISGNNTIPGASTIHFDSVAKEKIFRSIDKISGLKKIIKESYVNLRNRLGRVPYLIDFYQNGEIDPLVIVREFKTYHDFLKQVEKDYMTVFTAEEYLTIRYLSKTILSGVRFYELEILKALMDNDGIPFKTLQKIIEFNYPRIFDDNSFQSALTVLKGEFVATNEERIENKKICMINDNKPFIVKKNEKFAALLKKETFREQIEDILAVGLARYNDKYKAKADKLKPFVLHEKYTRKDVCLLKNCGQDLSSTMYGMKRIGEDVFIFVTYKKELIEDGSKQYIDGKPDYADQFDDNVTFFWDSQIGKGPESSYMKDVRTAKNKHLFVKKIEKDTEFYYMGTFDIVDIKPATKKDNNNKEKTITKVVMKMNYAVRDDILKYLQSSLQDDKASGI